ncbi:MAG: replicative DNA helicase [Bacteroidia bacterium]|nr:replicative DNA helicase [Bacteroidia bacterium]
MDQTTKKAGATPRKPRSGAGLGTMLTNVGAKIPPQAKDVEEAVLGGLLLMPNSLADVVDKLHPDSFYSEDHQEIYRAIHELYNTGQSVDILTVTEKLKKNGKLDFVGGTYKLTQLTNRVSSTANIEYHSRIILQKFIQRELIKISSEITQDAFEDSTDVLSLLDNAEKKLFSVTEGNLRRTYMDMGSLIQQALKEMENAAEHEGGIQGVPSGFTELDRITSGWQKADLIIVAARPGMGKTAFTLSLARNAAVDYKYPVAFFSLEMTAHQLANRLISSESEIAGDKIRRGELKQHELQQLHHKIVPITNAPIFIDDTPSLSVFELRAKCRRLVAQRGVKLIVIDYLQLMTAGSDNKSGNREQEISMISRNIKSIAKELNVPIITLSQLSRDVEKRGGTKRPQLSDLRESGAIEQDADMVLFIYRPEYYEIDEDEQGNPYNGRAQIIVSKNRNGPLADANLKFIGHLTKFTDWEEFEFTDETQGSGDFNSDRVFRESRMNDMDSGPEF